MKKRKHPLVNIETTYNLFVDSFPKGDPLHIDKKTYVNVLKAFNKKVMDQVVEKGYDFKAPYIGRIRVQKRKMSFGDTKRLKLDYKAYKEMDKSKLVFETNEHSNNY